MSEAEKYLEMCDTALEDYEKGKEADQSIRTLYNRLYYASFYSAKAALLSENIEAKSHAGTADRVFKKLHKEKAKISKETAAVLSRIQTKRDISDYEIEIEDTEDDLEELEKQVKNLIEQMKSIVKEKDQKSS